MAVEATVKPKPGLFPEGCAVAVFPKRTTEVERREGRKPLPAPTTTGVIKDQKVTFKGLTEDTDYLMEAVVDEIQTLKVEAKKGKIKWTFEGQTGAALKFDAAAAELKANLEALSTIGENEIEVTGGPGSEDGLTPYKVKFLGTLAGKNVGAITASVAELEEEPKKVTITETTVGSESGEGGIQRTCLFRSPAE